MLKTMNKNKICAIIAGIIFLVTVVSIYFETLSAAWDDYKISTHFRIQPNSENAVAPLRERKILLWNSMFSDDYFYFDRTGHFDHCPKYNNCRITRERDIVTDFDAILFHGNDLNRDDLPEKREPQQNYVFVNLESPINRPITDAFFDLEYFNMTMTYRLDSDIPWPYKILQNIKTGEMVAPLQQVEWMEPKFESAEYPQNKVAKKTKMAAWLVSNCKTYGKREVYVDELKKYTKVDIIGKCAESGNISCERSRDCFAEEIEINYFFYLSFENSLCDDYVTEKFLNALRYNVVPVVYGGANYRLFAPPHSYIDALDFESPKALANHLNELSRNKKEYLKYFWWKKFYSIDSAKSWTLCHLCEALHRPRPSKSYSPLSNWFMKDKCPMQDFLNEITFATKDIRSHVLRKT